MRSPNLPRTQVWRLAGLAASFCIFSAPTLWVRWSGAWPSYMPATIAFAAILIAVAAKWDRTRPAPAALQSRRAGIAAGVAACVLLAAAAWYWMGLVMANPIDPNRADMLPVIQAALRRLLRGRDPYTIYHVPWEAPLGYGPVLWAPFLVPHLMHADLRVATIAGQLVVPLLCGAAAAFEAMRRRFAAAAGWLVVLAAIVGNPDLAYFTTVGHTGTYWPLLPLFAIFLTQERWRAAGFVLGLVVVGRSTMAAGVPLFFVAVWARDLRALPGVLVASAAPIVLLMAPFAIWDPHALWYGMIAVYPRVIKAIVWTSPEVSVGRTIGLTGWLVTRHFERYVELTQLALVLAVYAAGGLAIRRGARPLPWMAVAVLAFCMTTLWPLYYIYFDVLLLFVSGAIAETIAGASFTAPLKIWGASLVAALAVVAIDVRVWAAPFPSIDFGSPASARWVYQGFATSRAPGEPALPWIWGLDGTLALPRSSTTTSDVVIVVRPVLAGGATSQNVTALLNGKPLGTLPAVAGWQSLRFAAPADAWLVGANEFKLVCASATPPLLVGISDDPRHLSLAIRRLAVVPDHDGSRGR